MPIYEYVCSACNYAFEEIQRFDAPSLKKCPQCKKLKVQRKVSKSAFHLKGGGWYKDGYSVESGTKQAESTTEDKKDQPPNAKESSAATSESTPAKDTSSASEPAKPEATKAGKKEKSVPKPAATSSKAAE